MNEDIVNLKKFNSDLMDLNIKYAEKIEILNNIIKEAIEYIDNLSNEPNVFGHYGIDGTCKKHLLNILKGSDKE